ncbi:hypothetical protein [Antarcticimicrobium sediminis]|nr:hypothetical protein [Antarcticimicrobium sediminis]
MKRRADPPMPNTFASLMLLTWPFVCLVLFKRLPLERALIWCILGGYLLLPPKAAFDFPLVPAMDKTSLPNICAFLFVVLMLRRKVSFWPESGAARALVLLFLLGVIPTVLSNGEPVTYSDPGTSAHGLTIAGATIHDLLSVAVDKIIVLLPFFLGRQLLASETGQREILRALMLGGLIYSIPALLEVRLSPQLNIWIYGFFQHDFEQMMRGGGFRPIVFLPHALWLALFVLSALLSTAALARRASNADLVRLILATVYLVGVLYLCKSLATQLYAIAFLPVIVLSDARTQLRLTALLALVAITYPILRNTGMIPLDTILEQASAIDPDRASSLAYRFNNEQILLDRAQEKPWFGWAGWGRNLLFDPNSGKILTVPDGRWIIVFGVYGWIGYIAEMGLLALPLLLLWWSTRKSLPERFSPYANTVAVILAVNMIDMLLNATLIPLTWLCTGALLGYAETLGRKPRFGSTGPGPLFGKGPVIGRRRNAKTPRTTI